MRSILVAAFSMFLVAGCAAPESPVADVASAEPGEAREDAAAAPEDPARGSRTLEGRYRAVKPMGEFLQEDGNKMALDVAGWEQVAVTLDSSIEIDLMLLPPGCASAADPCAIRFSPPEDETDGTWEVPRMGPGPWTIAVQADEDDYSFVDGIYAVIFDYTLA